LAAFFLDQAQRRQTGGTGGADQARAVAMRATTRRGFQNAGAQALAAHLHEAEGRDAAHLNARGRS
jgi:hypothetical protein